MYIPISQQKKKSMFIEIRVYCKFCQSQKLFVFNQKDMIYSFAYQGMNFESVCYKNSCLSYIVLYSKPSQNSITDKNDSLIKSVCDYISGQLQCPVELHITAERDYYSENGVEVPKFDARDPDSRANALSCAFANQMENHRILLRFDAAVAHDNSGVT